MHLFRSKFKAGAENVKSSLKSISAHELLSLLDSKDYVGSVVAKEKYNGKVFTDEQLAKLLDRSDLSWGLGDEKKEPVKCEKSVDGVFRVIDVDDKKPDLGSVKDKQ